MEERETPVTARASTFRRLFLLWRYFSLRHARQDWRQACGVVLLLALGVATYLSISMASRSAVAGFKGFTDAIEGGSDLTISGPAGVLDNALLPALREALGQQSAYLVPVIESSGVFPASDEEDPVYGRPLVKVVGIDLVAVSDLPVKHPGKALLWQAAQDGSGDIWSLLRSNKTAFLASPLAQEHGLEAGDEFRLILDDHLVQLKVAGILPEQDDAIAPPGNLMLLDMGLLQQLTGRRSVDRVEVLLPSGADAAMVSATRESLLNAAQGRWQVSKAEQQRETGQRMTAAFRMNLQVLSLLAIVVAVYLILMALDGAVVRRRNEIAVLRSMGVPAALVRRAWLVESAAYGLAGGLLGVLLGWGLAQFTVRAIVQTINALYAQSTAQAASLQLSDLGIGLLLGVGGSLLAGAFPARDAAQTPPAQMLSQGSASTRLRLLESVWLGVALAVVGIALVQLPPLHLGYTTFPAAGYAAALIWLLSGTIFAARIIPQIGRAMGMLSSGRAAARVASSRLRANTSRHQLAVAGLFISIAMAAAMAILVGSFDKTLRGWVSLSLRGDIFMGSAAIQGGGGESHINEETWQAIAHRPEVSHAELISRSPIELNGLPTTLLGSDLPFERGARDQLRFIDGPADVDLPAGETAAIVTESFAYRFGVGVGDSVTLPTASGAQGVKIAGIYADYGDERGSIAVPWQTASEWMRDPSASNVTLYLHEGYSRDTVASALERAYPALLVRTQPEIRDDVMRIFSQTFGVTDALRLIALAVALGGLALALGAIARESHSELQTLAALGMPRRQRATVLMLEGVGLTAAGLVSGLVTSTALGWLLVFIINRQSFGWTLQFHIPLQDWIELSLLSLVCGAGVSWWVGIKSANPWRRDN